MTDWDAERDLAALLDALSAELLAMPEHELVGLVCGTGKTVEATAQEMRRLVAVVDAQCVAPHVATAVDAGLRASIARSQ
jgi:hypothetical protein